MSEWSSFELDTCWSANEKRYNFTSMLHVNFRCSFEQERLWPNYLSRSFPTILLTRFVHQCVGWFHYSWENIIFRYLRSGAFMEILWPPPPLSSLLHVKKRNSYLVFTKVIVLHTAVGRRKAWFQNWQRLIINP